MHAYDDDKLARVGARGYKARVALRVNADVLPVRAEDICPRRSCSVAQPRNHQTAHAPGKNGPMMGPASVLALRSKSGL